MVKEKIMDGRSYSHQVLEHYRFRAIKLHKEGKKVNEISHFFGIHRGSVSRWITIYKRGGKKNLRSRKAEGPACKLTSNEMGIVLKILRDDATNFGFETPLWTCKRLQKIIYKKTGKNLHSTSVMRWLKRWGFTNQKPERRAKEQDSKAVKKWIKEEWPKIRASARRSQAMIYFLDEAGVSLTAVLGKTWAPKGKTPVIRVTGNKGGFCVTSAISPAEKMVFRIEKEKVNFEKHIEFLKYLLKHHPWRKVVVIEDRAPPHRSGKVRDFVEQNKKHISLHFLPSYSPELNPDEHVWAHLKSHKLKAHQAQTTSEFKKVVHRKMQSIQRTNGLVNSFFIGTYVT